jgi:hypothetical protein
MMRRMTRLRAAIRLLLTLLFLCTLPSHAHKASDSYLSITTHENTAEGQWDIALRDLEMAIGVDGDADGEVTWNEIRAKHRDIAAYALSRLELTVGEDVCRTEPTAHLIDHHTDGAYAVLRFTAHCEKPIEALGIRYGLLFDIDPQHKGLLRLDRHGQTMTAIFSPQHQNQRFEASEPGGGRAFLDYFKHGVWHIWIGFDHILFLVSLLLPAVLVFQNNKWSSSQSFQRSFIDVLKIVTAFTLAHSITLSMAALNVAQLPSRWVETAIAASVIVAALNNLVPVFYAQRWIAAFVFGLIHGFGFAGVLSALGLPRSALVTALVGFNVGVEAGQLAIVAIFLPLAYGIRRSWAYRRLVLQAGSMAIAMVALVWLIERAFEVDLVVA